MSATHGGLLRRDVIGMVIGGGAAALLAACGGGTQGGSGGGGTAPRTAGTPTSGVTIKIQDTGAKLPTEPVTFRWIDSGDQKAVFFKQFFPAYQAKHPNITIKYDPLPWNEISNIVPLGIQNGNVQDVFQLPPTVPHAQAVRENWVSPLDDIIPNFQAWKKQFPKGAFVEGITDFNGKSYTIPLTTNQRYGTLLLYNLDYMQQAGYDPANKPLTWDEFRDAAKKITKAGGGQYYGLILEGNQTARFSAWVGGLAEMAGAAGGEMNWKTGQYNYTSDQWIAAIELLLAMRDDGSILPGSLSLNAPQARARMPQGVAGMILQGPWNIPIWQADNPGFKFGVASQPVPNKGTPLPMGYGPGGSNQLWVYAKSPLKAVAGDILYQLGTPEMQRTWADIVGAADPPIFVEASKEAKLDPLAKKALALFEQQMRLNPSPEARNPDVAMVLLEQKRVTPDPGETIQGIFTGQLKDVKGAMKDLQDRTEAELQRAIKAAQDKGAHVSREDWVFPNWDPTKDYSDADYAALSKGSA
jgi:multiple sugar transport system substrate-binding protein